MSLLERITIGSQNLLKLDQRHEQMQNKLKARQIEYTLTQISKSFHLRSLSHGFEIQFSNNKIQTFFAYFRTKKFKQFKGQLPYFINQKWTLRTAILFFGQPKTKSKHIVEIIYDHLGIGIVFQGLWSKDDSIIEYCYFFQPSKQVLCSYCKKQALRNQKICKCNAVQYCSQTCQQKHIGLHQIICQDIDERTEKY